MESPTIQRYRRVPVLSIKRPIPLILSVSEAGKLYQAMIGNPEFDYILVELVRDKVLPAVGPENGGFSAWLALNVLSGRMEVYHDPLPDKNL